MRRRRRKLILAATAVLVIIVLGIFAAFVPYSKLLPAYSVPKREEGAFRIHFLDVGQGDCTVVEFPDGEVLVVDAGDGSFTYNGKIVRYLKGLEPKGLTFLLTHANIDHYGGFERLLQVFSVGRFYLPVLGTDTEEYRSLLDAIEREGCVSEKMTRYSILGDASGAYCVCLSPHSVGETDINESSTVLYFQYEGVRILLAGDITSEREEKLVREYALGDLFDSGDCRVELSRIDVLKQAHHGSGSASSRAFMELVCPSVAVVSCGRGNPYSHPSGEALSRLKEASPQAEIYRTDERGDIVLTVKDGHYTIFTEKRS